MIHPFQITKGVMMRGTDEASGSLFSYVDLEARVPAGHPLRKIRQIVNDALASLDVEFAALYTDFGRPSIAPERLIRASLLQMLFSIRSERQLMEQMDSNLLFRSGWVSTTRCGSRPCSPRTATGC
jgi:transposase